MSGVPGVVHGSYITHSSGPPSGGGLSSCLLKDEALARCREAGGGGGEGGESSESGRVATKEGATVGPLRERRWEVYTERSKSNIHFTR